MNCLCNNNYYLYLLIILLVVCGGGCGCVNGIIEKICNCGLLIPLILLFVMCYCGKEKGPGIPGGGFGCGCGK